MANTNSLYQIFGGYRPKDRAKKIRRPLQPIDPLNVDPEMLTAELTYALEKDMEDLKKKTVDPINPSTYAERLFIEDVKKQLVVQATPQKVRYDQARALEFGDEEQTAGVQTKLNINPYDWYKDPQKELKKVARQFGEFFNWSDFSTYAEMETLWRPLLDGESNINPIIDKLYNSGGAPYDVKNTGYTIERAHNDFDATSGVTLTENTPIKAGGSYKNFIRQSKASGARNQAYREWVKDASLVTSQNLQDAVIRGIITDPKDILIVEDYVKRVELLRDATALHGKGDSATYVHLDSMGNIVSLDKSASTGLLDVHDKLSKLGTGAGPGLTKNRVDAAADVKKIIDSVKNNKDNVLTKIDNNIAYYRTANPARLDAYLFSVKHLVGEDYQNTKILGGFLKDIEEVEASLNKLHAELTSMSPSLLNLNENAAFIHAKGLVLQKKELFGREGPILFAKLDRIVREGGLELGSGPVAELITKYNDPFLKAARSMSNLAREASSINSQEAIIDFVTQSRKLGPLGVVADVGWNIFRQRLDGFTPAQMVKNALEKNHYFGLNYIETRDDGKGFANKMMGLGIFKNDQRLDLEIKKPGVFSPSGEKFSFVVNSNFTPDRKYLKFGNRLYDDFILDSKIDPATGERIYNYKEIHKSIYQKDPITGKRTGVAKFGASFSIKLDDNNLIDLLNGNRTHDLMQKLRLIYGDKKTVDEFLAEAAAYTNLLLLQKDSLGLEVVGGKLVNSERNKAILKEFLTTLKKRSGDPNYVNIFFAKAGLLQKLSSLLNKLQNSFFMNVIKKFGKYAGVLNPIAYAKRVGSKFMAKTLLARAGTQKIIDALAAKIAAKIASKVALKAAIESIAQAIAGSVAAATGGITEIITAVVAWITTEIVVRVLDKAGELVKSMKEGRFFEEVLEDSAKGLLKTGMYLGGIFACCCLIPGLGMLTTFMSAITPVDPTIMSYVDGGHEHGGPGGALICDPTICTGTPGAIPCFIWYETTFTGAGVAALPILQAAEQNLGGFTDYVERLCEAGPIYIEWGGPSTACGWAASSNTISFGNGGCWAYTSDNQNLFNFLMAHESGHIFDTRRPVVATLIQQAINIDGRTLPTYVGGSCAECSEHGCLSEDIAETIGNYVSYHRNCGDTTAWGSWGDFWAAFPAHRAAAVDSGEIF